MRGMRGITLVALVITIIVLLILAGVTMYFTIGENGLIGMSSKAREEYEKEQEKEQVGLDNMYSQMLIATNDDSKVTISVEDLNKIIEDKINEKVTGTIVAPDYEKREKIEFVDKSYTVEKDGYVQVSFSYTAGVYPVGDSLSINGESVFLNNGDISWLNPWTPIYPVKKGDIITVTNTAQVVKGYYYPIR